MDDLKQRLDLVRHLLLRLERLSADSHWAHRASGIRGSLLKFLDQFEASQNPDQPANHTLEHLDQLIRDGFEILEKAAREIRPPGEPTSSGQ